MEAGSSPAMTDEDEARAKIHASSFIGSTAFCLSWSRIATRRPQGSHRPSALPSRPARRISKQSFGGESASGRASNATHALSTQTAGYFAGRFEK